MTNNKAVQLAVNMDIKTADEGVTLLMMLGDAAKNTGMLLSGVFDNVSIQIGAMVTELENAVTAITNATAAVNELREALEEQGGSDLFFNAISTAISSLSLACDLSDGGTIGTAIKNLAMHECGETFQQECKKGGD